MSIHRILLSSLVLMAFISPSYAGQALTLKQAQKGIATAFDAAEKVNAQLSCAVVNARGDLIAVLRMDGAKFFTPSLAEGKALASAVFGQPSGAAAGMTKLSFFPILNASLQNRVIALQGAMPILSGKVVLGGIGCSGSSPQFDEDAAKAALSAFK